MPELSPDIRIVIENVYPELDGGRYAVKRVIGDTLEIWADILMDGHEHLKAAVYYQIPNGDNWVAVSMTHSANDRFYAAFPLEHIGKYHFTIRAWPDVYGTWVADTRKKRDAGQNIDLELIEGRQILDSFANAMKAGDKKTYQATLRRILKSQTGDALADGMLGAEMIAFAETHAPHFHETVYKTLAVWVDRKRAEFSAWYELFPRSQGKSFEKSGTFKDVIARLPDIQAMGFDVLYFPPIHPIGKAFRKGKNNSLTPEANDPGSPYAIGSELGGHKDIEPGLGTLKDFRTLVKAANKAGMDIALDFAVQCSPDHPYVKVHPDWFTIRPDGTIKYAENPPKKYQDIVNVNFASEDAEGLWQELRSIVEYWIEEGVTIFRVDNPHTKPFAFWEWLIEGIHEKRPDILFLSEAFTRPKIMYQLAKLGFSQSYTYFTWRNTKAELTEYLTELTRDWPKDYFRPNFFPVTPDIFPYFLHDSGRAGFTTRLALAATLSSNYGMLAGYELCEGEPLPDGKGGFKEEYLDSEKYEFKPRDWNAPGPYAGGNIKAFVAALNRIRQENPALQQFKNLSFHSASNEQVLFYRKWSVDGANQIFVIVNLDPHNVQEAYIDMPLAELGLDAHAPYRLENLLEGHEWNWMGARQHQRLDPNINPIVIFKVSE